MSATYDGLEFETHLLAKWAAFFDLAGWKWARGVSPIGDWRPDYRVSFPCDHSECGRDHVLLVSVLPADGLGDIKHHPALKHIYEVRDGNGVSRGDAGAVFGSNPSVSEWQMSHGAGGGSFKVSDWIPEAQQLWAQAEAKAAQQTKR